jgi:hypothetical protein
MRRSDFAQVTRWNPVRRRQQFADVFDAVPDCYARLADFRRALGCCYIELIVILLFFALMSHDQTAEVLRINVSFPDDSFFGAFADWTSLLNWGISCGLLGLCVGAHANYMLQRKMGWRFGAGERLRIKLARIIRALPFSRKRLNRPVRFVLTLKWRLLDHIWFVFETRKDLVSIPFALASSIPALSILGMLRAMDITDFFGDGLKINCRLLLACLFAGLVIALFRFFWFTLAAFEVTNVILRAVSYVALFFLCLIYGIDLFHPAYFASSHMILVGWVGALLAALMMLDAASEYLRKPILGVIATAAVVFALTGLSDNHTIRSEKIQPNWKFARQAFSEWLSARSTEVEVAKSAKKTFPVFVVAAEGGGIRAAYMTNAVLSKLEADNPGFLHHVFSVIGVSGGSVGAAMFSASHISSGAARVCGTSSPKVLHPEQLVARDAARAALGSDFLSPAISSLFGLDFLARFLPGYVVDLSGWDRGAALEDAIDMAWQNYGQPSLRNVCFGAAWSGPQGDLPALILLSTDVRSGQRVAASHLKFLSSKIANAGECSAEPPASEARLRTLAAELPDKDVPLLTAAVMSARFPIISPSARLPCSGSARRVVDGGYFENSGVTTVLELLDAIAPETGSSSGVQVMVLRIANGDASTGSVWTRRGGGFAGLMPEPVRALLNTQDSRAAVAVANLESRLGDQQITFALSSSPVAIPLGWQLGKAAQAEIDHQVGGSANAPAFQKIASVLE